MVADPILWRTRGIFYIYGSGTSKYGQWRKENFQEFARSVFLSLRTLCNSLLHYYWRSAFHSQLRVSIYPVTLAVARSLGYCARVRTEDRGCLYIGVNPTEGRKAHSRII